MLSLIKNQQNFQNFKNFLVGDQLYIDSNNNQDTAPSEPLIDQRKDITVDISVETLRLNKYVKTPVKPNKIDVFTAQLVIMKAFFMNEVF